MPLAYDDVLTLKGLDLFEYQGSEGQALESVNSAWQHVTAGQSHVVSADGSFIENPDINGYHQIYAYTSFTTEGALVRAGIAYDAGTSYGKIGPAARINLTTGECYYAVLYRQDSKLYIYHYDGSAHTILASFYPGIYFTNYRTIFLRVNGTTLECGIGDVVYLTATHSALSSGYTGFYNHRDAFRLSQWTSWRLGYFADSAAPPNPCTLSYVSKTSTSLTVRHTPPADPTNYAKTRLYVAVDGADPTFVTTSTQDENIVIGGLQSGTEYVVFGVTEDSSGNRGLVSRIVIETLPKPATGITSLQVLDAVKNALEGMSNAPDTVYVGRRWPDTWDAPQAALVRLEAVESESGHGGVEGRVYEVVIGLRVRLRDRHGESQQQTIASLADSVRETLHLVDPTTLNPTPNGLWQVEVGNPVESTDVPDGPLVDYIESLVPVRLRTFEA